jgi:hypothetical protein
MNVKKIITKEQVNHIIKKYHIRIGPFTIRDDGLIVNGNVKISNTHLKKLPLKFIYVYGNFLCHSNELTSLKGCPAYIAGDFNCYGNQLTSLKYGPKEVGGDFSCHENVLTSLKGSPNFIKGNFNAFLNQLKTLEGGPERIEGNCYIHHNELTSLKGGPKQIFGSFFTTGNLLSDLVGCSELIGNILLIDNTVTSLYMNQNCEVKRVEIQIQERLHDSDRFIPEVIFENQKHLSVVFKYARFLDIFSPDGVFNSSNFEDIIFDIETGLR